MGYFYILQIFVVFQARMHGLASMLIALFIITVIKSSEPANDVEVDGLPPLNPTTPPQSTSSSSQEGFGAIGAYDPLPYPVIDSYSQSKTVRVGDGVEFECSASDAADHLPNWPKHDMSLDLYYENDVSRDLTSTEHNWWADFSKSTKSRPSLPKGRIDITEVAEVYMYKEAVSKSDEGWYRCRACIYKDTELQACDVNLAKFYLKVLRPMNSPRAYDDPVPPGPDEGPSTSSPQGWGGNIINIDNPRSSCQVFGDPHVVSFDGMIYNLPGSNCDYVLALDQAAGTWFIYGRMRPCGNIAEGVCLESVTIYARGDAVELQRGWVVNHNGQKIETMELNEPMNIGELEVEFKGSTLTVSLLLSQKKSQGRKIQDWLRVNWDGLTTVTIEVPQSADTQGLCGDNNQDPMNDFEVWGAFNKNLLVFSESMKVDRDWECGAGQPALTMDQMKTLCGAKKHSKAEVRCGKIFAANDFRDCVYDKQPYIDACIYDQCKGLNLQNDLYPWMIIPKVDKVLMPGCNAAEAYAMKCSLKTWNKSGDVIAPIDMPNWEDETYLCPSKASKKQNIPKLGCPQSFM